MITRRFINTNGIRLHVAEAGEGPLVLLLHGFPECWYSWRHQIPAIADAGYHVVAPDQRGYGQSDSPESVDEYSMLHLVGDIVGLIHALGEEQVIVIGHDWGAPVAWQTAVFRPDIVRGVVGLSAPPMYRTATPPLRTMRELYDGRFYFNRFEEGDLADTDYGRDPRTTLRRLLYSMSGDNPNNNPTPNAFMSEPGSSLVDRLAEPPNLPSWLTEADLDVFADSFKTSGFTGGLNWYRAMDRTWELTAPWAGATVQTPALFVAGDRDAGTVAPGREEEIASLPFPKVILPGVGHWIQQERPGEITKILLDFLAERDSTAR